MFFMLCLLLFSENPHKDIAIHLSIGATMPDFQVTEFHSGRTISIRDVMETGVILYLSPTCEPCRNAHSLVRVMEDRFQFALLFVGDREAVSTYMKEVGEEDVGRVYIIDVAQLKPYNIKVLPSLTAFYNDGLFFSMHGRIDQTYAKMVDHYYKVVHQRAEGEALHQAQKQ